MNNRESDATNLSNLPEPITQYIGSLLDFKDQKNYSNICRATHTLFQPILNQDYLKILSTILVSNKKEDINLVKKCLDHYPDLLLMKPANIIVIEKINFYSTNNIQKFYISESPLITAFLLERIEILELMFSYLDKIQYAKGRALFQLIDANSTLITNENYTDKIKQLIGDISKNTFGAAPSKQSRNRSPIDVTQEKLQSQQKIWNIIDDAAAELNNDVYLSPDKYLNPAQLLMTAWQADCSSIAHLDGDLAYAQFLMKLKASLSNEVQEFFTQKKAPQTPELFKNSKIRDEFIACINQRKDKLRQLRESIIPELAKQFMY